MKKPRCSCRRCRGVFAKGQFVEEFDGKKYHAYCAGAERKERQGQQPSTSPWWFALFFPWLLAW